MQQFADKPVAFLNRLIYSKVRGERVNEGVTKVTCRVLQAREHEKDEAASAARAVLDPTTAREAALYERAAMSEAALAYLRRWEVCGYYVDAYNCAC